MHFMSMGMFRIYSHVSKSMYFSHVSYFHSINLYFIYSLYISYRNNIALEIIIQLFLPNVELIKFYTHYFYKKLELEDFYRNDFI